MNPFRFGAAALFALAAAPLPAASPPIPQFDNFPAPAWSGRVSPTVIQSADDRKFAARLRQLSGRAPNFAGHYTMSSWGCGASCTMSVAVDAQTGNVIWLPFTVCCWNPDIEQPVQFRRDSKLVIVHGSRNETGNGTYYYLFDQNRFTLLRGDEEQAQQAARSGN